MTVYPTIGHADSRIRTCVSKLRKYQIVGCKVTWTLEDAKLKKTIFGIHRPSGTGLRGYSSTLCWA